MHREGWANAASLDEQRPATFARDVGSRQVRWLPAASYRRWRDVGVRGFTAAGEQDPRFRGRWAGRNAVFCDLMVRTGLRLGEQATLALSEVPLDSRGREELATPQIVASDAGDPSAGGLREVNVRLRAENRQLREHEGLACAQIQRLSIECQQLREQLEKATNVARIRPANSPRQPL